MEPTFAYKGLSSHLQTIVSGLPDNVKINLAFTLLLTVA